MARRIRDQAPLLGVPVDVTVGADLIRDLRVCRQFLGILHNLRNGHLTSRNERRLMTSLARQTLMRALGKELIGLNHEVARQAKVVVVLHVVVGLIRVISATAYTAQDQDAQDSQCGKGQAA
jgi:hypothetical protein